MSKKDAINVGSIALGVAAIFATGGGALAAYAGVIRAAQVAFTLYGLYDGYRASKKAQQAIQSSLEDRTVSVASADEPKSVVYGRRIVKGRPVFIVEPRNGTTVNQPNYYFWMVYALEVSHEIDAFEEVYFNGEPIGPYLYPLAEGGTSVAPGSKFYRSANGAHSDTGTVGPDRRYVFTRTAQQLHSVTVIPPWISQIPTPGDDGGVNDWARGGPVTLDVGDLPVTGNGITLAAEHVGWTIMATYSWEGGGPHVSFWAYHGRDDQTVNREIQQASPEWTDNCRLLGNPYLVIRIDPDMDMFPSGAPVVSARIRGKRCFDPWTNATVWTANPALHLYDYMKNFCNVQESEINLDLLLAVKNASNEPILKGYLPDGSPDGEARFEDHAILSTEQGRVDNLRIILSSIGGSMTYSAGRYDIRAAIQEAPTGVGLTEDQLGNGDITVQPRPSVFEGLNGVRGVFPDMYNKYSVTDYPPYHSPFYTEQDGGVALPQQIDFASVTSPHQAQRIARIQLHLARNTLTFEATWNLSALQYSPGQVVPVTMSGFGWTAKPFRIMKREIQDDGQIKMIMREEPASIYNWTYQEGRDPDPSPNTNLPSPYDVAVVTGLRVQSGPGFAEYEAGGQVKPSARATWDLHTTQSVLYGGNIELWYRWGEWDEWQKQMLSGTAIRHDMPVRYNKQMVVQVRGVNAIQVAGPWAVYSHRADGAPTSAITGSNLLPNPLFTGSTVTASGSTFNISVPGWAADGPLDGHQVLTIWNGPTGGGGGGGVYAGGGAYFKMKPSIANGMFSVRSIPVVLYNNTKRLVAYADVNLLQCFGAVAIEYFTLSNTLIGRYTGEWIAEADAGFHAGKFGRAHVFVDVPAGAQSARLCVYGRANTTVQAASDTQVFFRMPYLGVASDNQQFLPDWAP